MKRAVYGLMVVSGLVASQAFAAPALQGDANGDGKVTKEEFLAVREAAAKKAGKEFNAKAVENQFAAKDKNKDGVLSAEELAPAAPKKPAAE